MAEIKTRPTAVKVSDFLASVPHPGRRADAERLCACFSAWTGEPPVMWGPTIVGFGRYRYTYDSGHSGEMCRAGFSPRKANLVVYVLDGFPGYADLLGRLGRHKVGKSCLYLGRLDAVDMEALETLVRASWEEMARRHPG